MKTGYDDGWEIGSLGKGQIRLLVRLAFEYLMCEMTLMKNLASHGVNIKIKTLNKR